MHEERLETDHSEQKSDGIKERGKRQELLKISDLRCKKRGNVRDDWGHGGMGSGMKSKTALEN